MLVGAIIANLFWLAIGGLAGLTAFLLADFLSTYAARWLESPREDTAYTQPHGDVPAVPDFSSFHSTSNSDGAQHNHGAR